MNDMIDAVKARAQGLMAELSRPGGLRGTIESVRRRMAIADQRRAIRRARDEVKRLEGQLDETVTVIGLQSVALYQAGRLPATDLGPLCERVIEIRQSLAEQKDTLERLEDLAQARRQVPVDLCPSCGQPVPMAGIFCPHCGATLEARMSSRVCATCRSALRQDAKFCPKCGTPVSS